LAGLKMLRAELFEGQSFAPDLCPAQPRHTRALIQALVETSDLKDRRCLDALLWAAEGCGSRDSIGRGCRWRGPSWRFARPARSGLRPSTTVTSPSFSCSNACLMPSPPGS